MKRFDRWLAAVENLSAALAILALVFILGAVCLEIVLRNAFDLPQTWVTEFTEYALLYVTFLGSAWLARQQGHVSVDLLTNALGGRWRRRLALASAAVCFAVAVSLTVFGAIATWDAMRRGTYKPTILEFPTWIVLLAIPLGSALLCARFARSFLGLLQERRD